MDLFDRFGDFDPSAVGGDASDPVGADLAGAEAGEGGEALSVRVR